MNNNIRIMFLMLFLITILVLPSVSAQTRTVINSADWKDVYSGVIYSNLNGYPSDFLTSTRHATILKFAVPKNIDGIELISSRNNPFAVGYKSILEAEGYPDVEEVRVANGNLELGQRLTNINNFIVVDPAYGYNAISVAPYAVLARYYVLFADRRNINQVANFLNDKNVNELIIYGQVDREVKNALESYSPRIINTGDRFDNNIEMVKLYQEEHRRQKGDIRRQAILSNGEFIESSIVSGKDPVLFIGFSNVPEQVREYISQSGLEVGTLVGNELIGTATFIRRQTGLSVFVKFGQGSRTPTEVISQVEDLDRFPIPRYALSLDVVSAVINTATNMLEVTYQNAAPIATYFRNIQLRLESGEAVYNILDEADPYFIDSNDFRTLTYELTDEDGNRFLLDGDVTTLFITTIYGESPKSLEQTLEKEMQVESVSIIDGADIEILDVAYKRAGSEFLIKIKNIGNVDAFVSPEIHDLYVNGEYLIFSSQNIERIRKGATKVVAVPTTMEEEDVPQNENIKVRVYYGERESSLIKMKQGTFNFKRAAPDFTIYIIILLIILILALFFVKKKCKHCGHKNPVVRKTCRRCHRKL